MDGTRFAVRQGMSAAAQQDPGVRALEHAHTTGAIRARLARRLSPSYLRDWIYGGIDGAVTTFAVVSGAAGAGLSPRIVVVLGLANLLADGFSMAASNFAGTTAEREEVAHAEAIERRHVRDEPEGERREVREIFRRKGLTGRNLEDTVNWITGDPDLWLRTMLAEEYGLAPSARSRWRAGLVTFAAFGVCGAVPLLPYLAGTEAAFPMAALLTAMVFLAIGALKGGWVGGSAWRAAAETFLIGAAASALAYGAGIALTPVS